MSQLDDKLNKAIDERIAKVVPVYLQSSAFVDRKLTDTPTDALQVTPKKYVDAQVSSVATTYPITVVKGGTGQTTATEGFDALAPTTTAGDTIYRNSTDNVRLPIGSALTILRSNAGQTAPEWVAPSNGGDLVVTVNPPSVGIGAFFTGTLLDFNIGQPTWQFADAVDDFLTVQVKVPATATSIASIKVYYIEEGVASTNLYLRFYTSHSPVQTAGGTYQNDQTDTFAAYASGGTQFKLYGVTVPAAAYNGLTSIVAGSLIGINIDRDASNVLDTYARAWSVVGVEFTFA